MAERGWVVGTAGHVDHGKTSLVKALTGVDADRLPEEKARGITIELGFAPWAIDDETRVGIVDVPGHERFVRTMVAGATGIDVVVLVVAADDGVMAQTREHLDVCRLLGVTSGVVAITKADLVDDDVLALVRDDVAEAVRGTFLEGAEVVVCSTKDGRGLGELAAAVKRALGRAAPRATSGPAFLPVDRVFVRPGFGTVVTGTLVRGAVAVGDDVDVLPDRKGGVLSSLKVRGIEVHGAAAEQVAATSRVALNLRGVEAESLGRGMVVTTSGWQTPTNAVDAEIELVEGAAALEKKTKLALHVGTAQVPVTASVHGGGRIGPKERGLVRLASDAPFVAFVGERFVLRASTTHGQRTIGGGRVVDPHPSLAKGAFARGPVRTFEANDAKARARLLVADARDRGLGVREAARRMPPEDDAAKALADLAKKGEAIALPGDEPRYVDPARIDEAAKWLLDRVRAFHEERPLVAGIAPGELESRTSPHRAGLVRIALERLTKAKKLVVVSGLVALADRAAKNDALDRVAKRFAAAKLAPPRDEEAEKELGLEPAMLKDALAELKRQGKLRLVGGFHFDEGALEGLRRAVAAHFASHAELTPADAKEMGGGLTRKHAIVLLEWLDREGLTKRTGDVRIRGPKLAS